MVGANRAGLPLLFQSAAAHYAIKRLKESSDALSVFYSALLPVIRAGKMGVDLFQLPPNLKADNTRLAAFLNEAAPEGTAKLRVAFEFRHPSWFTDETFDLLRQHEAALCVAEVPIPQEFAENKGTRQIKESLAFDPPTRHSRSAYLGVEMSFRLVRGKIVTEVIEHYWKRDNEAEGKHPELEQSMIASSISVRTHESVAPSRARLS
jgi:uncharacterized protein YecE (DUF72 family)